MGASIVQEAAQDRRLWADQQTTPLLRTFFSTNRSMFVFLPFSHIIITFFYFRYFRFRQKRRYSISVSVRREDIERCYVMETSIVLCLLTLQSYHRYFLLFPLFLFPSEEKIFYFRFRQKRRYWKMLRDGYLYCTCTVLHILLPTLVWVLTSNYPHWGRDPLHT